MKQLALIKGFRLKMPYADRVDKHGNRTINFYCHMSKSANRRLKGEGCPFRMTFKDCPDSKFRLHKEKTFHNHELGKQVESESESKQDSTTVDSREFMGLDFMQVKAEESLVESEMVDTDSFFK